MARRFHWRRSGRRNAFLLGVGIIWIIYGWSLLEGPQLVAGPGRLFTNMGPFNDHLSTPLWSIMWFVSGAVGMVIAIRGIRDKHYRRASVSRDALGFNAVLIPAMLWVMLHGWSWIIALLDIDEGNARGWVSASVWAISVMAILIVAGWPEIDDAPSEVD